MASPEVIALEAWKPRIWKHLHDMFVRLPIGKFYRWEPESSTGEVVFEKEAAFEIVPTGFAANELSVAVGESSNRREHIREREFMTWNVLLTFSEEVLTEYFDNQLFLVGERTIPPSTAGDGERIPPIYINVTQVDLTHPPMHDASSGSVVRYTIQVIPGRI